MSNILGNIRLCGKCNVPLVIGREFRWTDSGVITLGDSADFRWVFAESDNIDDLFSSLEELIGLPLEPIIIESRRRETKKYMEKVLPPDVRLFLEQHKGQVRDDAAGITLGGEKDILEAARMLTVGAYNMARIYGYGDLDLTGPWESILDFPWRNTSIRNPYSLPMMMAECLGSSEALDNIDQQIHSEQTGKDTYVFRCHEADHPINLEGKLRIRKYGLKTGDIKYEHCPECGLPVDISSHKWDLGHGTIIDPETNRRMALYGPYSIDSVLNDLESELGDAIPNLVIEAQRKSIMEMMSGENWLRRAPDFKKMLAVHGLGNLVSFDGDRTHVSVIIENSCMHLRMIGIVQGLVELAMGWEGSKCEYDLSDDGDLAITTKI